MKTAEYQIRFFSIAQDFRIFSGSYLHNVSPRTIPVRWENCNRTSKKPPLGCIGVAGMATVRKLWDAFAWRDASEQVPHGPYKGCTWPCYIRDEAMAGYGGLRPAPPASTLIKQI